MGAEVQAPGEGEERTRSHGDPSERFGGVAGPAESVTDTAAEEL